MSDSYEPPVPEEGVTKTQEKSLTGTAEAAFIRDQNKKLKRDEGFALLVKRGIYSVRFMFGKKRVTISTCTRDYDEAIVRGREIFRRVVFDHEAVRAARAMGKLHDIFGPLRPPDTPGVYAIVGLPGYVKVGRTKSIRGRLTELQCACPIPLKLVAVLSLDPTDEPYFHEILQESWVRGEWFVFDASVRRLVYQARQKNYHTAQSGLRVVK